MGDRVSSMLFYESGERAKGCFSVCRSCGVESSHEQGPPPLAVEGGVLHGRLWGLGDLDAERNLLVVWQAQLLRS